VRVTARFFPFRKSRHAAGFSILFSSVISCQTDPARLVFFGPSSRSVSAARFVKSSLGPGPASLCAGQALGFSSCLRSGGQHSPRSTFWSLSLPLSWSRQSQFSDASDFFSVVLSLFFCHNSYSWESVFFLSRQIKILKFF
jgi:hypothetical protein